MTSPVRGLVDSHVHLHAYDDAVVAAMCRRASRAGVGAILAVAVDPPSAERTLWLADRLGRDSPRILPAVGWHPLHLGALDDDGWATLERLALDGRVVAIGECGIDAFDPAAPPLDQQVDALSRQAQIGVRLGLPLLLHLRGPDRAVDAALETLADAGVQPLRAVVHYFTGDADLAERCLDAGLLLSVGKPVTRAENVALRQAIAAVPLDRLLLETDTYPVAGRTTEPADVALVASAVAELHGTTPDVVARLTGSTIASLLERPLRR